MTDNVTDLQLVPRRRKIVGFYVVRDGEQIGWFSSRSSASKFASRHGAAVQAEYA